LTEPAVDAIFQGKSGKRQAKVKAQTAGTEEGKRGALPESALKNAAAATAFAHEYVTGQIELLMKKRVLFHCCYIQSVPAGVVGKAYLIEH
jgi:hypothetical protein